VGGLPWHGEPLRLRSCCVSAVARHAVGLHARIATRRVVFGRQVHSVMSGQIKTRQGKARWTFYRCIPSVTSAHSLSPQLASGARSIQLYASGLDLTSAATADPGCQRAPNFAVCSVCVSPLARPLTVGRFAPPLETKSTFTLWFISLALGTRFQEGVLFRTGGSL